MRGNSCNDAGQVLVAGTVADLGLPEPHSSLTGLWLGDGTSAAQLIGLSGDTIPGTATALQGFLHPAVNRTGDVAFFSGESLCLKRSGEPLQKIAESGMALPPSAGGASFGELLTRGVQLSADGDVVFQSSNGLWVYTKSNRLLPIAQIGETIEHDGHAYTIATVTLLPSAAGGEEGRRRMVSDVGTVALLAKIDSSSDGASHSAILLASLPEGAFRAGAPTAHPDLVNIRTGPGAPVTIAVLANDIDPQGEPLTISSVSAATAGTVEIVGMELRYLPSSQFSFEDRFTYTVKDREGFFSTAEVIVRKPLPRLRGSYATTFGDDPTSGGKLTITLGANGQVTGRLQVGARTFTFRGLLTPDGTFTRGFAFGSNDPITLTLHVGPPDSQTPQLTGTVESSSAGIQTLEASPAFGLPPGLTAQRLSMQLRAPGNPGPDDPGFKSMGFAIGKFTPAGRVTLVGRLLDNRAFTAGAAMKRDGNFALQAAPYGVGRGSLRGNFAIGTPIAGFQQWSAELAWNYRPPTSAPASADLSFSTSLDAALATYRSTPGEPNHNWEYGQADLQIVWGDKIYREIAMMEKKPAVFTWLPHASSTVMSINRKNGLLVGSFAPNPASPLRKNLRGAIYNPRIEAAGIVPHPAGHGYFLLKPPGLW